MSLVAAGLVAIGVLLWPDPFGARRLSILPKASTTSVVPRTPAESVRERGRRWRRGRREARYSAQDLIGLLDAIAPALDAGMAPASALRIAAEARSGSGPPDELTVLALELAAAAADGVALGPLWLSAAHSAGSAELVLLAQAWSLTEDLGAPLAQAVRTTAGLLEARVAHERRLAAAVAGAKATVNLLTFLPIAGPVLALVLGISPAELFGDSRLTQGSLVLGLALAGFGRWWVRRMVAAVARGPVIA